MNYSILELRLLLIILPLFIKFSFYSFFTHRKFVSCFFSGTILDLGGRVVRWSWINFQYRGVLLLKGPLNPKQPTNLLLWMKVGLEPVALAVGAGTLFYLFSSLSPSLWETVRYRLKYCLKGPLSPQQPTYQLFY